MASDDASPPGTHGGPASEPSPRAGDDATAGGPSTEGSHEEDARCSSQPDDADGSRVPQSPLAFTIDFGNNKEVDTARYQNLFERYNARHRRNLSTSKVFNVYEYE